MSSFPITDTIYSVGILNPAMRIFDVVMQTEYGTSYNSYLVKGKDKTALIEVCHATFFDQYLKNISEVCDPAEIDYIILNHCEPDHSGALAQLLPHCPNATIVVSRPGSIYLKHITNCDSLRLHIPKDGETLDLGERPLQFVSAPFLHWPDSMFTWDETEHTLFSCDFYGAHYCEPYVLDTAMAYPEKYEIALKGYFDAIFGPFISHVRVGLDKSSSLPMERICTSHGPVLTKGCRMERVIALYRAWSKEEKKSTLTLPIFYCSAYGNTRKLAQAIQTGIQSVLPEAVVKIYDLNDYDSAFLAQQLNGSDGFAIGSPTINGDAVPPIWELLSHVDAINNKKKPALVFGSYGWSGEAVPNITARLQGLKLAVFDPSCKVVFVPSEQNLAQASELGRQFAQQWVTA